MASPYLLAILLCASFLFEPCVLQNSTEPVECQPNELSPDNENMDDGLFMEFAEKLELYTGLTSKESFNVTLDECGGKVCVVDPSGTAIWDARMDFYMSHMSRSRSEEEDRNTTLDGCLCHSKSVSDYQVCMRTVRENMITELDTVLIVNFKNIINSNCSLFDLNCVQS